MSKWQGFKSCIEIRKDSTYKPEFVEMVRQADKDFKNGKVKKLKLDDIEFGYKPADLAKEYGDKGTISKVLNYKQPLSLNMIRLFHKMLRIPTDLLTKEYNLS